MPKTCGVWSGKRHDTTHDHCGYGERCGDLSVRIARDIDTAGLLVAHSDPMTHRSWTSSSVLSDRQ